MGATGAVGQRFVQQLEGHPWFDVFALGASERSVGKTYGGVVRWLLSTPIPASTADMQVISLALLPPPFFSFIFNFYYLRSGRVTSQQKTHHLGNVVLFFLHLTHLWLDLLRMRLLNMELQVLTKDSNLVLKLN